MKEIQDDERDHPLQEQPGQMSDFMVPIMVGIVLKIYLKRFSMPCMVPSTYHLILNYTMNPTPSRIRDFLCQVQK